MKVSFSPKEMLAVIVRRITIFTALSYGVQMAESDFLGSVSEGVVKGFGLNNEPQIVFTQLLETIENALEELLSSPDYELPDECKERLRKEVFSSEKALQYFKSDNQVALLEEAIRDICMQSMECNINTLPVSNMAVKMICHVEKAIQNNHILTSYFTLINSKEILDKVNTILSVLTSDASNKSTVAEYSGAKIYMKAKATAENFARLFDESLFLEHQFEQQLRLSDIYVDSAFASTNGNDYSDFDELYKYCGEDSGILIEGDPGIGKSSLTMKIAIRYLNNEVFRDMKVFFIRGKEIRCSNGNPIEDILKAIDVQEIKAIDGSVIYLDAYDEISYVSESAERNQEYLSGLVRAFDNVTLIITSRPKYIKQFAGNTVKILGFSPKQRQLFLEKYNAKRNGHNKLPKDFIAELTKDDSQYQDRIHEILSVPMLLYIISVKMVYIQEIEDRFNLYEAVFTADGKGALHTRGKDKKTISQATWKETYELVLRIAKNMYFQNNLYISENDILSQIDKMKISTSSKTLLKNRFGVEFFLKGEQSNIFTFVHTSIYEHFAAKWLCERIKEIIIGHLHENWSNEQVISALNKTFNAMRFDRSVFYYVMHNINKGYFTSIFNDSELLYSASRLLNDLLCARICEDNVGGIPYFMQMKHMFLWVFNTFNIIFGMFEVDGNAHWVKLNHDSIRFLLKLKDAEDDLFLSRLDLSNIHLEGVDFGETHFINNDLTGANFTSASCNSIINSGQRFCGMILKSVDFWENDLKGYVFDESDLRFCDFRGTVLNGASFRGADLRGSNFGDADLYGVDFTNAHIMAEDFENAHYDECAFNKAIIHDASEDPNDPLLCFV